MTHTPGQHSVLPRLQPYPVFPVYFVNDLGPDAPLVIHAMLQVEFDESIPDLQVRIDPHRPRRDKERAAVEHGFNSFRVI